MSAHPGTKILIPIIRHRFIRIPDTQGIVNTEPCLRREVLRILKLFIADGLQFLILRGKDPQAPGIYRPVCLLPGIGKLVLKILHDLIDQRILIESIDRAGCVNLGRIAPDPFIDIIRYRLIISFPVDISLREHRVQHHLTPFRIVLRISDGIVGGRILGNPRNNSVLCKSEILHRFSEIPVCRCLNAIAPCAKIDQVQVVFENLVLGQKLFQLQGQILFLDLALDPFLKCRFTRPSWKYTVLQKLLRDRTCSLGK